jgi:peptide chain release factor 3
MTTETEIQKRRTFAIIAHPDAGKTTLTEKLLLFGGAIELAGAVKAKGDRRRARSDWMKVEQERGISVASSVMTFDHKGRVFNLLDTPGHEDFSEDTYRTLTAVDSAVMVLDNAKGIETQTLKLFEVCRLRDVPIITFINKMDREGQDPFNLLDEIEQKLALDVTPASWPIGMGRDFKGCYDLLNDELVLFDRTKGEKLQDSVKCSGLDDPKIDELLPADQAEKLRACSSARRSTTSACASCWPASPSWRPRRGPARGRARRRSRRAQGVGLRLQDPGEHGPQAPRPHRVRAHLASGHFSRGMKLVNPRTEKTLTVGFAMLFQANARELAEEAWAGDIIGLPNHGGLRIGDALTEGEVLRFTGIPSFAPELLRRVRPVDPMKAKHLGRALEQLAEEGAAQAFKMLIGSTGSSASSAACSSTFWPTASAPSTSVHGLTPLRGRASLHPAHEVYF